MKSLNIITRESKGTLKINSSGIYSRKVSTVQN